MQISTINQLMEMMKEQYESEEQKKGDVDPVTGLPYEDIDKMGVDKVFDLLKDRKR